MRCNLCNSAADKIFIKNNNCFYRCRECGLEFIFPEPDDKETYAIYDKNYYQPWGLESGENITERMKHDTFRDKLDLIEGFSKTGGKILDIGCATGFFLDVAKERGWDVYGVELSEYSSGIAGKRLGGERIVTGSLEQAAYDDRMFDVVAMTDLIEHVKDSRLLVGEVARILKPGGIIAVTTPDPASLSCRMLGRHWPHYKPEHLRYFTADSLELLLEPYGFKTLYKKPASKIMTFGYLAQQLRSYPMPVVTPAVTLAAAILPSKLLQLRFRIYSGELFMIAGLPPKGI